MEGVGIALVPSLAIPEECSGVVIRSLGTSLSRTVLLATRSALKLSPAGKAFWNYAKEWIPKQVRLLEMETGRMGTILIPD